MRRWPKIQAHRFAETLRCARGDRRRSLAVEFGGLSCLSPPAVPTSATAPPHREAGEPLAFIFAGPGGSPHHQTREPYLAPPRAIALHPQPIRPIIISSLLLHHAFLRGLKQPLPATPRHRLKPVL